MIKMSAFLLCLFFPCIGLYAIDIVILPINYYEREIKKNFSRDIAIDLGEMLEKFYYIRIERISASDKLRGITDADAIRVGKHYEGEYILYGSLKREGDNMIFELKMYNSRTDKYEHFTSSDTINNYGRLVDTVCLNILDFFKTDKDKVDELRRELERYKKGKGRSGRISNKPLQSAEKEFMLKIPVQAGYWRYLDKVKTENVTGIVHANVGVEICPELQLPTRGNPQDISMAFIVGYRYGGATKTMLTNFNNVVLDLTVKYNKNFYNSNWFSTGLGIVYDIGIWESVNQKYNESVNQTQLLLGTKTFLEYSYKINHRLSFDGGVDLYYLFTGGKDFLITTYIGTKITLVGGKINEK